MCVRGKDSIFSKKNARLDEKDCDFVRYVSGILFRTATVRGRPESESPFRTHQANFKPKVIAKKSPPNFGGSERFVYLCVRKITTNEITHKYSLT